MLWVKSQKLGRAVPNIVSAKAVFISLAPLLQHGEDSDVQFTRKTVCRNVEGHNWMGVLYSSGSHEVEVSSGVHSRKRSARSPSRLSRKAATSNADEESSSLQTLAAAADSGELNPYCLTGC